MWRPEYARVYGLRPWDMARLRTSELVAMHRDLRDLARQQQQT